MRGLALSDAMRGRYRRGSVRPVRSQRSKRLLGEARIGGVEGNRRRNRRQAVSYLLLRHPYPGLPPYPHGADSRLPGLP